MLKDLPSCYSALSFLRAHCNYILLKKKNFKFSLSLSLSLKNIFYFSLFLFFPSSLFRPAIPLFLLFFFFLLLSKIDLPVAPHLKISHDLDLNQWSYFPSNFFQWVSMVGHDGGDLWVWFGGTVVRLVSAWVGSLGYNFVLMASCFW